MLKLASTLKRLRVHAARQKSSRDRMSRMLERRASIIKGTSVETWQHYIKIYRIEEELRTRDGTITSALQSIEREREQRASITKRAVLRQLSSTDVDIGALSDQLCACRRQPHARAEEHAEQQLGTTSRHACGRPAGAGRRLCEHVRAARHPPATARAAGSAV